jgi:adenylate cyclase
MSRFKNKLKDRKITLWFSISASFILSVLTASILMIGISSYFISNFILDAIKTRIHDVVGVASKNINGDLHKNIRTEQDSSKEEFNLYIQFLNQIKSINPEIKYAYTLRKNDLGQIIFIVDSDPDSDSRAKVGQRVKNETISMKKSFDSKEEIVIEKDYYTDEWGTWITGYAPFYDSNGIFEGILAIDVSVNTIKSHQYNSILVISLAGLFVVLLSIVLSMWLSRKITTPVLLVTSEMSEIQKFNISNSLSTSTGIIEIREMISALENMKKSLRSFKKYVPSEIVSDLIQLNKEAVLEVDKKDITVFFSDIADFTSISEQVKPEILSKMLGIYLGIITKTILSLKGTVDKYIGDAVMALWSAPKDVLEHEYFACKAALECQKKISKLNSRLKKLNLPVLNTRIGLNSGEAIVGNMGYKQRLSFTAIGDTVNLSSRLEALNKVYETNTIVGETVFNKCKEKFLFRFIDLVAVKGKTRGIKIYELVEDIAEVNSKTIQYVENFNRAMNLYLNRNFEKALFEFLSLREQGFNDFHLNKMIDRCSEYKLNPPSIEWNGIVKMKEK